MWIYFVYYMAFVGVLMHLLGLAFIAAVLWPLPKRHRARAAGVPHV